VTALVGDVRGLTVEERFPTVDEDADEVILAIVADEGIRLLGGPNRVLPRPAWAGMPLLLPPIGRPADLVLAALR
jgi:hypothetical protein